jgi:2-polyprenyl-3-methyl-5-hydroxy-6-metoxy-1,4-benzoquinol methylase
LQWIDAMGSCHLCGEARLLSLIDFGEHPIAHRFVTDPLASEYVHPVRLCFCENCGLTQLDDPIPPELLYTEYSWLSAWKPQPHIPRLVSIIGQLSGIGKNARILEVGCNDGTFLAALMEAGYRNVVGIEPAQDAFHAARGKGLKVVHGYFSLDAAQGLVAAHGRYDLLITRQVLEHVTALKDFRAGMRTAIRPGGYALIEVPNFDFSLKANDYSAIWEEHVNHFTGHTLNRFYSDGGFRMVHSETAPFCGEALITVAEYSTTSADVPADLLRQGRDSAFAFRDSWPDYREALLRFLGSYRNGGRRVAVYGAGCRACCLINYAGLAPYIDAVLDDQPEKQGKFMPGSHLPIEPGEKLNRDRYDLCMLAVNEENEHKVIAKHRDYQERGGQFVSLLPPSAILLRP